MTIFASMAPLMGMPEMNIPQMLAGTMKMPVAVGWIMHFMIGIVLGLSYGIVFSKKLPGSNLLRGLLFSVLPWLMAQLFVMPMMAVMNNMSLVSGLFSGSFIMAAGSLMGHFVFGAVLGVVFGSKEETEPTFEHSFSGVNSK